MKLGQKIAVLLMVVFSMIGCTIERFEDVELSKKLQNIEADAPFRLDTMCQKDCDMLYVVNPYEYSRIDSCSFHIPVNVRKHLESMDMFDSRCTLLFFSEERFVCYSDIRYEAAIFSYLKEKSFPIAQEFYMDSLRVVRKR